MSRNMHNTSENRRRMISEAAYFYAERHGFEGDPESYWLEAEMEVDRELLQPVSKRAFQQKLEEEIDEWDARLDELKARALEAGSELEKQIELLAARREVAGSKLEALRRRTEGAWEDLKEGAEKSWAEMRDAFDSFSSHFK